MKGNTECDVNYYSWGSARISHILRNPFYKGAHLICQTYNRLGKNACTGHKIEARDLYNLVLADIQELDEAVLNRLISRIVVGGAKRIDRQKYQEVKIIYNFVGEIPDITK